MNIVLLKKDFDLKSVNIETEEVFQHLKDFLIEDWSEYIKHKLCSIYWYYKDEIMLWFITISTTSLRIREEHLKWLEWKMNWLESIKFPIPWVLIWKLLVSSSIRWQWIWKDLILYVMSYCFELSRTIWIRFITVDSHRDTIDFYKKIWFVIVEEKKKTTLMVFDLNLFDDL